MKLMKMMKTILMPVTMLRLIIQMIVIMQMLVQRMVMIMIKMTEKMMDDDGDDKDGRDENDTYYVLSFTIIMLNTSLHNPSVKDKPSVDQFISMNRGINNNGDLLQELLVSIREYKNRAFKIPEDDGNDLTMASILY